MKEPRTINERRVKMRSVDKEGKIRIALAGLFEEVNTFAQE
jgi:hypothetical protein